VRRLLALAACSCVLAGCGDDDPAGTTTTAAPAMAPVPTVAEIEAGQGQEGLASDVRCRKTGERDFSCRLEFPDKPPETRRIHVEDDGTLTVR
jgi:hypothetical protein